MAALAAVGVLIYLVGLAIAPQQTATVAVEIRAPIERVWKIVTAWEEQPKWRTTVSRVEVTSAQSFTEYPVHGRPVIFCIVSAEAPRRLELEMSGALRGTYVATLTEADGVTTLAARESVSTENPFLRVVGKVFFNLESFARQYAGELKRYAESAP